MKFLKESVIKEVSETSYTNNHKLQPEKGKLVKVGMRFQMNNNGAKEYIITNTIEDEKDRSIREFEYCELDSDGNLGQAESMTFADFTTRHKNHKILIIGEKLSEECARVQDSEITEEALERKAKRLKDYRRYADLKDDEIIDHDNIDEWALNRVSSEHIYDVDKLRSELTEDILVEETLGDLANNIDAKVVTNKGQIENVLDWALDANLEELEYGGDDFKNVLLSGGAGIGKTARVKQWAKENNINLLIKQASVMDDTDLGGAISPSSDNTTVVRLSSTELDQLNRPRSVLFLDEYNRAPKSVRGTLLTLIKDHTIPDAREENGMRFFPNFLFTVAAINPSRAGYDTDELDIAERSRFRTVDVIASNREVLKHFNKVFDDRIERSSTPERRAANERRKALANALLTSKEFEFDSIEDEEKSEIEGNKLQLNPRSLLALLTGCDGTKEDFLDKFNDFANNLKKRSVERILANYKDVEDKANSALEEPSESNIFAKPMSNFDKLINSIK